MTQDQTTYQPVSDQIANLAEAVKLLTDAWMAGAHRGKLLLPLDEVADETLALIKAVGRLREAAYPEKQGGGD